MNKHAIVYMVGSVVLIGIMAAGVVSKYKNDLTQQIIVEENNKIPALLQQAFQNGAYFGAMSFTKFQANGITQVPVADLVKYATMEAAKAVTKDTNNIVYPVAMQQPQVQPPQPEPPVTTQTLFDAETEVPMATPPVTDNIQIEEQ